MKTKTKTIGAVSIAALIIIIAGIIYSKAVVALPQDDAGAKLMHFDNVRGNRYTEIFLIGGNAITKNLKGGVYNTIGMNSPTGTGDSSPAQILDKVDVAALKKEYDVLSVFFKP